MKVVLWILALTALGSASLGGAQDDHLEEHYGYVEVRPGANMFWVMYHVDQPGNHFDYPLIMWLQGGPGASGVGYGNFEELGPYDINGNPREFAWTKKANVMFVDNPVGTGYSYVESPEQLATDNAMIASDLVEVVKSVFTAYPDMQVMPFYVFAESYGGKMTVDFALEFEKAIKNGEVVSDFRGVALGDSWISPMDSVNTWGPFLYQMGFVNAEGEKKINEAAAKAQAAVDAELWVEATTLWSEAEGVVDEYAHGVNFYNVLAKDDIYRLKENNIRANLSHMDPHLRKLYEKHVAWQTRDALGDFMNGPQAEHWKIPDEVVWDSQGSLVFSFLAGDFMKPVIDSVVKLLTETNLDVVVFTGNLDLICDTPGTYRWIENMEWPEKPTFMAAPNEPIKISAYSATAATIQEAGRFYLYTIMRSGHMVPIDAPEMSLEMLDRIFGNKKQVNHHQESQNKEQLKHQESQNKEQVKQQESQNKEQEKHQQESQNKEQMKQQESQNKEQVKQQESQNKEQLKHQEESKNPEMLAKVEETVKPVEEAKEAPKQDVKLELEPEPQAKPHPKKLNMEELKKETTEKEAKKEEKAAKDKEEEESKERSEEVKVEKEEPKQQKETKKKNKKEKTSKERTLKEQSKKEYKKEKAPKQENIEMKKAFKKEKVPEQEMKKQDTKQKMKQDKYKVKENKSEKYKQSKVKKEDKKKQENKEKKEKKYRSEPKQN